MKQNHLLQFQVSFFEGGQMGCKGHVAKNNKLDKSTHMFVAKMETGHQVEPGRDETCDQIRCLGEKTNISNPGSSKLS